MIRGVHAHASAHEHMSMCSPEKISRVLGVDRTCQLEQMIGTINRKFIVVLLNEFRKYTDIIVFYNKHFIC